MGASVVFIIKCLISHPSIQRVHPSITQPSGGRNATQQKHQERKRVFVRSSLSQPPQLLLLAVLGCSRGRLSSWPLRCLRTTPTRSSCTPSTMALSLRSLRCWSASIRTFHSAAYVVARSLAPLSLSLALTLPAHRKARLPSSRHAARAETASLPSYLLPRPIRTFLTLYARRHLARITTPNCVRGCES